VSFPAQGGGAALLELADILSDEVGQKATAEANEERERRHQRALAIVRAEFKAKTFELFRDLLAPGATCDSVAREHGMSRNAVYCVKSRVLNRLRQYFFD
jgi:hypothetical protein